MPATTKLTPSRRAIAQRIATLHRRGEALNLTAVERRHPDLLEAVLAEVPYWGWRRALEAAGLTYEGIRVELTDGVTCHLCDAYLMTLASHLSRFHGVEVEDYRAEFPGAEMACEEARRLRDRAGVVPHWEPVWSRVYILDRLAWYAEQGHPLTSRWAEENDRALLAQVFVRIGSWESALLEAGIDPEQTRLARTVRDVDDGWLLRELAKRQKEGLPLGASHLRTTQRPLYDALKARFGSVRAAVEAAGADSAAGARGPTTDTERLLTEAREVAALAGRVDHLREVRAFQLRWSSVAMAHFGSWRRVAEAAGVPLEGVQRAFNARVYGDRAAVLAELGRRHQEGVPMHLSAVTKGDDSARDHGLFSAAVRHFGSWRKAIAAAGRALADPRVDRAGVRPLRGRYPSGEAVIAELQRRARDGEALSSRIIVGEDRALYDAATRTFTGWRGALRAAGFDAIALGLGVDQRRGAPAKYPDRASVAAAIQWRARSGLPVNAHAVSVTGPGRDHMLVLSARRYFGSWDEALRVLRVSASPSP